jgi:hypothetical protein
VLRDVDRQHLEEHGYKFATYQEGNITLLVIENYVMPAGYTPEVIDLLLQIPADYPDAALDMWWVYPTVTFANTGAHPLNTQVWQAFAGYTPDPAREWQRFSRHPQWRAGKDDLRTYLVSLRSTMENEAGQLAA